MSAVIFDVGGVLIDWNPRHLYRKLFDGDADDAMERFLAEVCTPEWNLRQDAGRPFAEAVAELAERFPEHADLIAAYDLRWEEMLQGAHVETVEIVRELRAQGTPLYCLTNSSTEKFPLMQRRFDVFDLFDGIVVSGEAWSSRIPPSTDVSSSVSACRRRRACSSTTWRPTSRLPLRSACRPYAIVPPHSSVMSCRGEAHCRPRVDGHSLHRNTSPMRADHAASARRC
jgi:haloacid dehalogenase-like hydrolase